MGELAHGRVVQMLQRRLDGTALIQQIITNINNKIGPDRPNTRVAFDALLQELQNDPPDLAHIGALIAFEELEVNQVGGRRKNRSRKRRRGEFMQPRGHRRRKSARSR